MRLGEILGYIAQRPPSCYILLYAVYTSSVPEVYNNFLAFRQGRVFSLVKSRGGMMCPSNFYALKCFPTSGIYGWKCEEWSRIRGLVVFGMHRREVKYLLRHEAGALECAESQYGEGNVLLSRQRTEESEIARLAIFSSRRSLSTWSLKFLTDLTSGELESREETEELARLDRLLATCLPF